MIKGGGDDIDGGGILEEERDAYPLRMKKNQVINIEGTKYVLYEML